MDSLMTLKPRMSEKAYGLSQSNTYVFIVPNGAPKQAIAAAVTKQFQVTVTSVNVANIRGKAKRTVRKGGRPIMGRRADIRQAYVTIKEGEVIPVFASLEEAGDKDDKPAKKEKK